MKPFSLNIALAALAASLFLCCAEVPEELANDPGNEACSGGAYYNSPGCPGYAGSPPSSSSLRQSSSGGAAPGELLCSAAPEAGAEGEALMKPTVTCGGIAVSASSWAGSPHAPDWDSPKEGSYSGIVAIAACGGSSKMADCPGLLTVIPAKLACGAVPSTGIEGMPVTKPAVLCDGIAVPAESWQPASLSWSSPEEGVYSNIKATAKCGGASKTVACSGTLAVVPPGGVLTCDAVPSAGAAGVSIAPPAVKCDGAAVSSGITWEGAPNWGNPSANTYGSVKAKASCGGSSKTANCSGTLAVVPAALTCAAVPSTGFAGAAITPPAVKCDGVNVYDVAWSGAPAWGNPSAGSYGSVKATATCGGISRTASCSGTLKVSANALKCSNNWREGYFEISQGATLAEVFATLPALQPTASCGYGTPANPVYTPSVLNNIGSIAVSVTATCPGGSSQTVPCGSLMVVCGTGYYPANNQCVLKPGYGECVNNNGIVVGAYGKDTEICRNAGTYNAMIVSCDAVSVYYLQFHPNADNTECSEGGQCVDDFGNIVGFFNKATMICRNNGTAMAEVQTCGAGMVPDADNSECLYSGGGGNTGGGGTPPTPPNPPSSPGKGNNIANYKTKTIGTQVWMAENLNYDVAGSKCYDNSDSNCNTYGRLYDWATANTVCPSGWHLPTNAEWDALYRYVDGTSGTSSPYDSPTAGRYLKSVTGWNSYSGIVNEDTYGFAALPGGLGSPVGGFFKAGYLGDWWSASENDSNYAYGRYMEYLSESARWSSYGKTDLHSVRCVKD